MPRHANGSSVAPPMGSFVAIALWIGSVLMGLAVFVGIAIVT